jgi:hypothetical protein
MTKPRPRRGAVARARVVSFRCREGPAPRSIAAPALLALLFLCVFKPAEADQPRPGGGVIDTLAEAARWLGGGNPTGTAGPWCADFVSFVLRRTGHRALPGRLALDGLAAGARVATPRAGDLAVMRGHITFFVNFAGADGFIGLGGNQNHVVQYSRYDVRAVVAWIRPA